jgi:hypothetical protein
MLGYILTAYIHLIKLHVLSILSLFSQICSWLEISIMGVCIFFGYTVPQQKLSFNCIAV